MSNPRVELHIIDHGVITLEFFTESSMVSWFRVADLSPV